MGFPFFLKKNSLRSDTFFWRQKETPPPTLQTFGVFFMLPIDAVLPQLMAVLETHITALLQAPPGAGKTTRVPLALLDACWRQNRKILMLEPRRLAARSAARYMAGQLGESAGQTVGYRTRLDTRVSPATIIEVVTEGILTRMIQQDPMLEDYAVVVFDEFHERSLQADLGLALVRESQQALREDLRVLVMSATLDTGPIARVLGDVPVISSEGRAYPVEVFYRPPARQQRLPDQVVAVIQEALSEQTGSLLVFLPGAGEIRRVQQQLSGQLPDHVRVAALFGNLSSQQQDQAISPAASGERKIVLATAIAETSLTIEGIRVVVDSDWSPVVCRKLRRSSARAGPAERNRGCVIGYGRNPSSLVWRITRRRRSARPIWLLWYWSWPSGVPAAPISWPG